MHLLEFRIVKTEDFYIVLVLQIGKLRRILFQCPLNHIINIIRFINDFVFILIPIQIFPAVVNIQNIHWRCLRYFLLLLKRRIRHRAEQKCHTHEQHQFRCNRRRGKKRDKSGRIFRTIIKNRPGNVFPRLCFIPCPHGIDMGIDQANTGQGGSDRCGRQ